MNGMGAQSTTAIGNNSKVVACKPIMRAVWSLHSGKTHLIIPEEEAGLMNMRMAVAYKRRLSISGAAIFIALAGSMLVPAVHAHDLPTPYAFTHKVPVYDADLAIKRPEREEDLEKVFSLAIEGDPEASILLWRLYASHLVPKSERKYFTGFHMLDHAISKHPDNAKLNLIMGGIYKGDFGVDRDSAKALAYYEKAAENGERKGYASIAVMYVYGSSDFPQDADKALKYFKKAAQRGDVESIMIVDNWENYLKVYVRGEDPK